MLTCSQEDRFSIFFMVTQYALDWNMKVNDTNWFVILGLNFYAYSTKGEKKGTLLKFLERII